MKAVRFAGKLALCWGLILTSVTLPAASGGSKSLPGHVPKLPPGLVALGRLPATNKLNLAIGLPLRDLDGLQTFLTQLYDPVSTNYHHYLTPDEFTERFGPTTLDYRKVMDFARTNGFTITQTHSNRLLLDVQAPVSNIEQVFHLKLFKYHQPTENRDFFAPDNEPSVDAQLPISDVSGLDDFRRPKPHVKVRPAAVGNAASASGSGPSGTYIGKDFRAAYLPDVTLTGAGQMVGLLQFDGFYSSDISAYTSAAGISAVPLQTVLLDGYSGTPTTSGNIEVSLDIEMTMSMAPGLSRIILFEGGPNGIVNDLLNTMAASNQVKQLSCSWGWSGGPRTTTDNIFRQMAAQGQSFFNASGDSDAFTTGASSANGVDNPSIANAPSSSPYITMVGGTTLATTGPGGTWSSETVWNWGLQGSSYSGSSGGVSSSYSLPSWQSEVASTANAGSASFRNIPDVALTGDNVYVSYGRGSGGSVGGTSCAAPLWAGVTALINQEAVAAGRTNVGFLNPAIYALGKSASFNSSFHDITTGNNFWSGSPGEFPAVNGYDLCTGWGTPKGQALIDALSGANSAAPDPLVALPSTGLTFAGPMNGPFNPESQTISLTNSGSSALTWSLINTSAWLTVSATNGTLAAHSVAPVSAVPGNAADTFTPGSYNTTLTITNSAGAIYVPIALQVGISLMQNGGFESGTFSGWTFSGNTVIGANTYNAVENVASGFTVVHSGSYGAFMGDTQLASLTQNIPTIPGQYYLLSLWVDNPVSGTTQQFFVNWSPDSDTITTLYSILNPPSFAWTNLQFLVRASGTNALLQFEGENDPGYFGLDDVALTPVPMPAFNAAGMTGTNFQLAWTSSTGLVYQVQYTTNLQSGGWINLGPAFTATNFNTIVSDPGVTGSPARFYRLMVSP